MLEPFLARVVGAWLWSSLSGAATLLPPGSWRNLKNNRTL